jgi:mannose-6-phosphate isomerase-like protein (cupin superfamily)
MLKARASHLLAALPGPVSSKWPQGERFVQAFARGSMSVEMYAPVGKDPQSPHTQDELYIVHTGEGEFVCGDERVKFAAGDVLFVPAGVAHRFENFTSDFATWVVFYGPSGGEASVG